MMQRDYPESARKLDRFLDFVNSNTLYRIEEVYNLTFHIQAICFLDIGYVLFGEDYKRGDFLVHMKREQEKIGHDCGCELPDNLAMILELMALSDEEELVNELGKRILIPAADKMSREFATARIELRAKLHKKKQKVFIAKDEKVGNVYEGPVNALLNMLRVDFDNLQFETVEFKPEFGQNFLVNCSSCSEHEPVVAKKVK